MSEPPIKTALSVAANGRTFRHRFKRYGAEGKPEDQSLTGEGWTFQTLEQDAHTFPMAILATDPQGRKHTYVAIIEDDEPVESLGFELLPETP